MKVIEAIQVLETMPAGADVNVMALEAAVERNKNAKKAEIEEKLAKHAVQARGYESFLKASNYMCSVYVNNTRNTDVNFDDAYTYVYVDCGSFFDIYRTGYKEPEVQVTLPNE